MLKQQWQAEEDKEKRIEQDRSILNRERNLALIEHNQQEKLLRE